MRRFLTLLALLAAFGGMNAPVAAHQTTLAYISVERDGRAVYADLTLAFRDLDVAVGVDDNFDGLVTWNEAKAKLDQIEAYALARFSVSSGGRCTLARQSADAMTENGEGYLKLALAGTCPTSDTLIAINYALFFEIDPTSRALLRTSIGGEETSLVFSAERNSVTLDISSGGALNITGRYFIEGINHLLSGPDHMLFLLVLVLPGLYRGMGLRATIRDVLLPITGFTVAHAMTLTAAATGLLRPPAPMVEAFIALTIMLTALDNIWPFIPGPRTSIAFAFGLVHGFGFASALGILNLSGASLAMALLGFNLGIESGQAMLALAVMPVLYLVRNPARRFGILPLGASVVAGLIALNWFIERAAVIQV